ncbi:hypothetical protein CcI49_19840 [Frankia sp. CcI49]|nr:hypothetical protein ACG83_40550 [Frankia sp. R43]KPM51978.1 hypothetical protein ACG83_30875 [Frankia sp. R43]ONH58963.1 hypothetical protein CcI49_19840 [Frankia sp. CcI49]
MNASDESAVPITSTALHLTVCPGLRRDGTGDDRGDEPRRGSRSGGDTETPRRRERDDRDDDTREQVLGRPVPVCGQLIPVGQRTERDRL